LDSLQTVECVYIQHTRDHLLVLLVPGHMVELLRLLYLLRVLLLRGHVEIQIAGELDGLFILSLFVVSSSYLYAAAVYTMYDELGNDAKWGKREVTPDAMGQYLAL